MISLSNMKEVGVSKMVDKVNFHTFVWLKNTAKMRNLA